MGERYPDRDLHGAYVDEPKQENEVHISNSMCMGRALKAPDALQSKISTANTAACEKSHQCDSDHEHEVSELPKALASTSEDTMHENDVVVESTKGDEFSKDAHLTFEDLDSLMSDISNMRDNLRVMPDFRRREMAPNLAMKMAAMFGESSDEDIYE